MKLFVSFSYLLTALAHGVLDENDLQDGVFIFQATRALVIDMNPSSVKIQVESVSEDHEVVLSLWHKKIIPALLKAEKEGRVCWRTTRYEIHYQDFRLFLENHGIQTPEKEIPHYPNLTPIKDVLKLLNPELTIVCA